MAIADTYVKTLPEALKEARNADYENGMATRPFTVERERCFLKVIRKAGSLDHPSILLFKVVPKNSRTVNYGEVSDDILAALDVYGDLQVDFQGDSIKTAVVDTKLL